MGILKSQTFVVGPCKGKGGFFAFWNGRLWLMPNYIEPQNTLLNLHISQYHKTPSILSIALNCYGTLGDGGGYWNLCSQLCSHQVVIKFSKCSHQVLKVFMSSSQCNTIMFPMLPQLCLTRSKCFPRKMFPKPITLGHTINSRIQFLKFSLWPIAKFG